MPERNRDGYGRCDAGQGVCSMSAGEVLLANFKQTRLASLVVNQADDDVPHDRIPLVDRDDHGPGFRVVSPRQENGFIPAVNGFVPELR